MDISYSVQESPDKKELHNFFENVFLTIEETPDFSHGQNQSLDEWFSIDELINYVPYGQLTEARTQDGLLVGAIFIGKQQPITWPDGNKMEIFILGVHKDFRGRGISKKLMYRAEQYAQGKKAKAIILNTHISITNLHELYRKLGYNRIGVLSGYYDNGDAVFFKKNFYYPLL